MPPTARPRADRLRPCGVVYGKLEGDAAVGKIVERLGERRRVRALEAGIQHRFAAAIGEGPVPSRPQTTSASRPADRSASRSPTAAAARAGVAQGAAQALGAALLGQRPERGGNRERHRAGRQGATAQPIGRCRSRWSRSTGSAAKAGKGRARAQQGGPPPKLSPSHYVRTMGLMPACPLEPPRMGKSLWNQQHTGRGRVRIGIVVNKCMKIHMRPTGPYFVACG